MSVTYRSGGVYNSIAASSVSAQDTHGTSEGAVGVEVPSLRIYA